MSKMQSDEQNRGLGIPKLIVFAQQERQSDDFWVVRNLFGAEVFRNLYLTLFSSDIFPESGLQS